MGRAAKLASYLIPGLVALITFVVFSPALRNGFVNWDDLETLVENQNFRGFTWSHLRWMFTTFHMGHYQPLSWLTFSLDYLLWGMDAFGYHLTNILLHSANAVLFYFVTLRLLAIAAPISSAVVLKLAAGFSALVFAIHPLRVESVAWATERRDVLSGFFLLLTVLSYLKAVGTETNQDEQATLDGRVSDALCAFSSIQSERHDASGGSVGLGRIPAPPARRRHGQMVWRGRAALFGWKSFRSLSPPRPPEQSR